MTSIGDSCAYDIILCGPQLLKYLCKYFDLCLCTGFTMYCSNFFTVNLICYHKANLYVNTKNCVPYGGKCIIFLIQKLWPLDPYQGKLIYQSAARHELVVCEHQIGSWGEQGALLEHRGAYWSTKGSVGELKQHSSSSASPWRHQDTAAAIHVETARERSGVRFHLACYGSHKGGPLAFNVLCPAVVYLWAHGISSGLIVGVFAREKFIIPSRFQHY